MGSFRRVLVGVCAVAVAVGIPTKAAAADAQVCGPSGYKLSLQSLTGPPRADLIIRISAKTAGCELPPTLNGVQVAALAFKNLPARHPILRNLPAPAGLPTLPIA